MSLGIMQICIKVYPFNDISKEMGFCLPLSQQSN